MALRGKLTTREVLEIYNGQASYADLGDKYDVSRQTVANIRSGKAHAEVTGGVPVPRWRRPKRPTRDEKRAALVAAVLASEGSHAQVAAKLWVHKSTVYNIRKEARLANENVTEAVDDNAAVDMLTGKEV